MKNLFLLICGVCMLVSCGGDNSASKDNSSSEDNPASKDGTKKNQNANKKSAELFVYEGELFYAPKCEDTEGIEIDWLNPNSMPVDYVGLIKVCYPDGQLQHSAGIKNNKWDGELYLYNEAGHLSVLEKYIDGLHVNSKMYRPDRTMFFQANYTNKSRDGEQIQYGLKGEVKMVSQWKDRKIIACEGDDCPEL